MRAEIAEVGRHDEQVMSSAACLLANTGAEMLVGMAFQAVVRNISATIISWESRTCLMQLSRANSGTEKYGRLPLKDYMLIVCFAYGCLDIAVSSHVVRIEG
jgi:hypothetical protein